MIRRKGRPGFWFQRKIGGRRVTRYLGTDYQGAKVRLRQFQGSDVPLVDVTVGEAAKRWLATYVETARCGVSGRCSHPGSQPTEGW